MATGKTIIKAIFQGQTTFNTSFIPSGAAGTVNGQQKPVGGLSGVTYDAINNIYYAISDDRSQLAPARFYTFTFDPATSGVTFTNVTPLKDSNSSFFTLNSLDPEAIALTNNGTVFISSEGEVNLSVGRVSSPFIKEFNLTTGVEVRSLPVPTKFLPVVQDTNNNSLVDTGDTQISGVRNNLAFESLTITPDQQTLYTATENALLQDGSIATTANTSRSRILQYNLVSGQPEKEYLYITDATVASNPPGNFSENGLVDLLAVDNQGTLLALERSVALGVGVIIKIYEISLQGATDISTINSLNSLSAEQLAAIQPVKKRLVVDLTEFDLPTDTNHPTGLDNIEGLAFGPKLADGRQSIVLVSDNNFSPSQFTQILALSADVVPTVTPVVETPSLLDDDKQNADADDPAIYLHPTDSAKSLVLTAVKNGGLRVYDLSGQELQTINPGDIRYNNIDVQYGLKLGGQTIDIAVASDRQNDQLAIFKINPNTTNSNYLEDITDSSISSIFQALPFNPAYLPSERSAYGLTIYRSPITNDYYVFVSRRETGDIAQLKLVDQGNGQIGAKLVRNFTVTPPAEFGEVDPQIEGMVVDQETGYLYIGQENVGIWKFEAEPNGSNNGQLIDKIKDLGGSNLVDDVEGLSIYYGEDGKGYLLVSSQGDNTFAVYSREVNNDFIGRFAVGNNGAIDSVQDSDGTDVINVSLGEDFPFGLFVTQDGSNEPEEIIVDDGEEENINSNFKFVPWENIANLFLENLIIDTTSYDPRHPENLITYAVPTDEDEEEDDDDNEITFPPTRLNKVGDDVFKFDGGFGQPKLQVTLTRSSTKLVRELCVFTVDDAEGRIDGIVPGTAGYTEAALARSQVIFSAIAKIPNGFDINNLTRKLSYNYGDYVRFYLVKNSSNDALSNNTASTEIVFSSSSTQKITDLGNNSFTLAWNSGSGSIFQDLVVKVQATIDNISLGTSLQGKIAGEVIDLLGVNGSVKADFIVNREAALNNFVGFYKVANINGGIDTNNDGVADILPGQAGYIQAAVQNRIAGIDLTVSNQLTATYTGTLLGNSLFAPLIIIDGKPDALLDNNTNNDPAVYFPYLGANSDKFDHMRLLADNVFGFEDLPNGGDQDFNDLIIKVNLTIT